MTDKNIFDVESDNETVDKLFKEARKNIVVIFNL